MDERQLTKARQLDVGREEAPQAVEDAFARDQGDCGRRVSSYRELPRRCGHPTYRRNRQAALLHLSGG